MLVLALLLLTLRTDRRQSPWFPVAALGLWGMSAIAEPILLCVLPAMAAFIYLIDRGRPTCGRLTVLTTLAAGFVLSQLLAVTGVGVRTWTGTANAVRPDMLVPEFGALGLVFLAAAALEVCQRPTREELLAFVGWLGVMGWTLSAETIDDRQLATVFVLTCPVVGFGMNAFLHSSPGRGRAGAAWLLCFVLPASNYARGVEPAAEQFDERAHWTAYARALVDRLPEHAAVVTTPNVHEPIASLWRFAGAGGRRVVEVPLDVRRVQELDEALPLFAFEPTRTHLELLGLRFSSVRGVPADASRETEGDRRARVRLRRQPVSRLEGWETCTAVGAQSWVNVSDIVGRGTVGIRFGSHAREATLVLYVAAGDRLPEIDQAVPSELRTRIGRDDFDLRDPGDVAALDRLLAVDGVFRRQFRSGERYVQRVHAGRDSDVQPLAAIRIGGRPESAIAVFTWVLERCRNNTFSIRICRNESNTPCHGPRVSRFPDVLRAVGSRLSRSGQRKHAAPGPPRRLCGRRRRDQAVLAARNGALPRQEGRARQALVVAPSGPPRFDTGSFRDPETRVVHHDGAVFRVLSERGLTDWRRLASTRFYDRLTAQGLLIGTQEKSSASLGELAGTWAGVLEHERLPVVSYPYEWSFGMLKDAALLQLDLTLAALDEDMTLKDATPFNVQWIGVRPTFIDVGSFTAYKPGEPWSGYRQFCETFLYPLLLQAYRDIPFHPWLRGRLDGMTAAECRSCLSLRDYLRPGVLTHVYLHAKAQARYEDSDVNVTAELHAAGFGTALIRTNIERLRRTVKALQWTPARSTWSDYQRTHSYDDTDLQRKADFVRRVLRTRRWSQVWDIGCNTGVYSRLAADHAEYVLALDADPLVIERLYRELRDEAHSTILPLVADVADPSPGLGWRGQERRPLTDRGAPDLLLCLAVVHHVVIGRNVPLADFIAWLAGFDAEVILEFVDRGDPMVERLLRNRRGQSIDYSRESAAELLAGHFADVTHETMRSGTRTLYHCRPTSHG